MKVLHINNNDIRGGAARAAIGISNALVSLGVESELLVQRKFSDYGNVTGLTEKPLDRMFTNIRLLLDRIPTDLFTRKNLGRYSFAYTGTDLLPLIKDRHYDILHLHWINEGFISLNHLMKLLSFGVPVVWTFHDMWAFTGGCHYTAGCEKYRTVCKDCPYLKTGLEKDFAYIQWLKKSKIFQSSKFSIVTCSNWLSREVKASSLLKNFNVNVIPNTIDTEKYSATDKILARDRFNLPHSKKLLLFVSMNADDSRKGFHFLKEAANELLEIIPEARENVELLVMGSSTPEDFRGIELKVNALGRLSAESDIIAAYNSADIFVAPSLEDNLPNTVMEALACGVPVAAFNIGGMPDMIEHKKNGYLADQISSQALANALKWLLEPANAELAKNARRKVLDEFNPSIVGSKYFNLYREILKERK